MSSAGRVASTGAHRYLAALPRVDGKVYLAWRLLPSDAKDEPFTVERRRGDSWQPVTASPVTDSTNAVDVTHEPGLWEYRVVDGRGAASESVSVDSSGAASVVAMECDVVTGAVNWRVEQRRSGGHNLDIADIDGCGVQEVIAGGVCYDGDGTPPLAGGALRAHGHLEGGPHRPRPGGQADLRRRRGPGGADGRLPGRQGRQAPVGFFHHPHVAEDGGSCATTFRSSCRTAPRGSTCRRR